MKCDKLKSLWVYCRDINENVDDEFIKFAQKNGYEELVEKSEVDEAIAELKQTIDELVGVKKSAEQILQNLLDCGLIKEWYFNGTFNVVLKADDPHPQIARLEAIRKVHVEAIASMEAGLHQDGKEIRRLKRALWLARAQAADGFATISRWTDYEDMHPDTKIGYRKWYKKFMHVKALCKAKAEEYK